MLIVSIKVCRLGRMFAEIVPIIWPHSCYNRKLYHLAGTIDGGFRLAGAAVPTAAPAAARRQAHVRSDRDTATEVRPSVTLHGLGSGLANFTHGLGAQWQPVCAAKVAWGKTLYGERAGAESGFV